MFGKNEYKFAGGPPVILVNDAGKQRNLDLSRAADVFGTNIFDTARVDGGVAVQAGQQISLFSIPQGGNAITLNGQNQYNKRKHDTSMLQPRQFPDTEGAIFKQIGIKVALATSQATTYATSGQNVALPTNPTNANTLSSATNLIEFIGSTFTFDLRILNKFYESGVLNHFPARQVTSGYSGVAGTGPFVEGLAQNGMGKAYQIAIPHNVPGQRTFEVVIEPQVTFTPPVPFTIQVTFDAIYYRGIQ
jgi:hypothetical protein